MNLMFNKKVELYPGCDLENGETVFLSFIDPMQSPIKTDPKNPEVCNFKSASSKCMILLFR
jgi:hypothetical protein